MSDTIKHKLKFGGVDIIDVKYSLKTPPQPGTTIDIKCKGTVFYPEDKKNRFQLIMEVNVRCEEHFTIDVRAVGKFELDRDIDEDFKKDFIKINAPSIVFPYLRAFVATFTANLGVMVSIHLPPDLFWGNITEIRGADLPEPPKK